MMFYIVGRFPCDDVFGLDDEKFAYNTTSSEFHAAVMGE
jgi:hypothetical protein